jgi:general stress protein 26
MTSGRLDRRSGRATKEDEVTDREPITELDARFGDPGAGPTPWAEVRRTIDGAELVWLSTVRADGRPHVTPLPAVWQDGALHFCTGAAEQKAVNLAANAHCALTTGNNAWKRGLDVVVEGVARRVLDEDRLRRLAAAWAEKYDGDWRFDVADHAFQGEGGEAIVFEVAPVKVLSFAKGDFAQTRYRFTGDRLPSG